MESKGISCFVEEIQIQGKESRAMAITTFRRMEAPGGTTEEEQEAKGSPRCQRTTSQRQKLARWVLQVQKQSLRCTDKDQKGPLEPVHGETMKGMGGK
mmetsp:Transcript_21034/g.47384  ORF Transcript_21034/g.47384 Transcript_21034/m.47384 type:complete len:98 (-) Transcript_21034:381-674(-)